MPVRGGYDRALSAQSDIRDFLISRRAAIAPDDVGIPVIGGRRRVAGLRREEVAVLAGISVEYYTQLERGDIGAVSEEVFDAVARALRLDDAERTHLANLVRHLNRGQAVTYSSSQTEVPETVRWIVDEIPSPALVRNRRLDIVYANRYGRAFYSGAFGNDGKVPNPARFVFLDRESRNFFVDWDRAADDMVALLRAESGRNSDDLGLMELIDELSQQSAEFRERWAAQDVLFHRRGEGRYRHPTAGEVTLSFLDLDLPSQPALTVLVFVAEPGSPSEISLRRLASVP
jgi:transcriptional regulator with XRE-family HTH domain